MEQNKEVQELKTLISDMSVSDKKVKEVAKNLSCPEKKDKDEIILLLKEKRPNLYSELALETASDYM